MPDEQLPLQEYNTDLYDNPPIVIPVRWRSKSVTSLIPVGELTEQFAFNNDSVENANGFNSSSTIGAYQLGGTATLGRTVCLRSPNYIGGIGPQPALSVIDNEDGTYNKIAPPLFYNILSEDIQIDWHTTLESIRSSYNPELHYIVHAVFVNSSGDGNYDLVSEGALDLNVINSSFKESDSLELLNRELYNFQKPSAEYTNQTFNYGPEGELNLKSAIEGTLSLEPLVNNEDGAQWVEDANSLELNHCAFNTRTVPMYLKVFVNAHVPSGVGSPEDPEQIAQTDTNPNEDVGGGGSNPGDFSNSAGSTLSGSGSGVSSVQGLNRSFTAYGNNIYPFDSIYLTGTNKTEFENAGGGVIGESGVFPNSEDMYIENIRLEVEGSNMSIIEVVDFDATPSLSLSEKVYAYIINQVGDNTPVFTGYVTSQQRRLTGDTQEIVYECQDLTYFLDQFQTPSHVIYRPPASNSADTPKTYDRVLKEMLNSAGLQTAIVDMPSDEAPRVEWYYADIRTVLEWATEYLGKYVYYTDRHGRLRVRATDSGSVVKSYRIPTPGEAVGSHVVRRFEPISDLARSRSKVIITGDFALEEKEWVKNLEVEGPKSPEDTTDTGFYWYTTATNFPLANFTRRFFFYFRVREQFADNLLSDPSKSAKVELTITTELNDITFAQIGAKQVTTVELPVEVFQGSIDGSYLIASFDKSMLPEGTLIPTILATQGTPTTNEGNQEFTFRVRYATKSRDPISASISTTHPGGTEVINKKQFKKIVGGNTNIDDSQLMRRYLNRIKEFYKPVKGGQMLIDGLDTDIQLIDKISITNTSLPSDESSGLIVYGIEYDLVNRTTTLDLSNKVYEGLPFFNPTRERVRRNNATLVRLGQLENS